MFTTAPNVFKHPTPSTHRLRRGLPGYLILFATHAFAPQRQSCPSESPSPLVFFLISTHFTATLGVPLASSILKSYSIKCSPELSSGLSHLTYKTACAPFTPSDSGQRLPPMFYRGCWHIVSRGFLDALRPIKSSYSPYLSLASTELYNPKTFFTHAALLRQACAHCGKFPTAASRRSLGRVSVPMWPFTLSGRLLIIALVGRYTTN